MAGLDDISFSIGKLQASFDDLKEAFGRQEIRFDSMASDVAQLKRQGEDIVEIKADTAAMKPQVEHYERVRGVFAWIGAGVVSLVASLSGFAGAYIQKKWLS